MKLLWICLIDVYDFGEAEKIFFSYPMVYYSSRREPPA